MLTGHTVAVLSQSLLKYNDDRPRLFNEPVAVLSQSLLKYNFAVDGYAAIGVAVLSQSLLKYNRSDKISTLQIVIAFLLS